MARITDQRQLLQFFHRGHRAPGDRRLGLEYELFVTDEDGRPVPYSGPGGVEELLKRLSSWSGWSPIAERGRLLGLRSPDRRTVTLEPGAQIEFSSAPCRTLAELAAQLDEYLSYLRMLSGEYPVRFLAMGAQPRAAPAQIERIPKARYAILEPYLEQAGELGLWMMKATCGIQANLDHSDAADAARKLRVAQRLAPLFNAWFANSPLRAGEASGFASWRAHVWTLTDDQRCGIVEACVQPNSTLDDYVAWALQAPLLFVERGGELVDMRGQTFADYLASGRATEEDWSLHLSTLFPEARFRPHLELRSADSGPPPVALALCALAKGLFYDERALSGAERLFAGLSHSELVYLWKDAHVRGLNTPLSDGRKLLDCAGELLGLVELAPEEAHFLAPLRRLLEQGRSQGEEVRRRYAGVWDEDYGAAIDEAFCVP